MMLSAAVCSAAVKAVEVTSREDVLHGEAFGKTGSYEAVSGRVQFAVDPTLAQNQRIADIDLAPKSSTGEVEFAANFYILRPRDARLGNGTALVEISNRGGKGLLSNFDFARGSLRVDSADAFGDRYLLEQGYTLAWVGWEFDVPKTPEALRLEAPLATRGGETITGLLRSEWTGDEPVDAIPLGDRTQIGYPVANENSTKNKLYVRDAVAGPRTLIPRAQWKFADSTHISLAGGFHTRAHLRGRV